MPDLFLLDKDQARWNQTALPDAAERERALDIRASWIVEAPAGSGKTGLLIQRYLKLLADGSVDSPEQVLAITFTRKATAEMRERVLAQLQSAASDEEPANKFDRETRPFAQAALARDRDLNWRLLDQPARLNIRTIDSVCSDIAGSLPLLSGSGGRRATVEDAVPLYLIAARRTFMLLGDSSDPELDLALRLILLHRDGNLRECEKLLAGMLEHRDQWGELIPLGRQRIDDSWLDTNVLPRLEVALGQAICAALTQLAKAVPSDILLQLTTAGAEMAHIAGYKGAVSPVAICAGRHTPPKEAVGDLAHWRALVHLLVTPSTQSWRKVFSANILKFDLSKPEQARLDSLVEQLRHRDDLLQAICSLGTLPPAKYPQEQWVVAKALFRILNRGLAELQLVFAERSEADFAELALAARTALRHEDGARDLESASSIHLQHLLVDEVQDTSSTQYELIQMLTRNWDGHSQTVFLVGDPKQSIYLFRQARVERFLNTMESGRLGEVPLGVLRLTANFRSQAALVDQFNEDFATIFPVAETIQRREDVPFVKAFAIRAPEPDSRGRVWHANVLSSTDPNADARNKKRQRKSDAVAVREIIERWQSRRLPPGRNEPWRIAVLVRSRTHLDEIVAELKGVGAKKAIPYRSVDIEPLETRPEVQDLFGLTRALLHPADRIAWLAVLRAPWCGLSLRELHVITGADDPAFAQRTVMDLLAERGDLLEGDSLSRLRRVWPVFEAAIAAAGRRPLAQTVERTWRSLGGDSHLTQQGLTNARRYFQLLDELEGQAKSFDLAALRRKMTRLYAAPIVHPGAVDLLTMHKAKGLEWDIVIVPSLERTAGRNRNRLLTWIELDPASHQFTDEAAHVLLAPIAGKGEPSAELNKWIASIHRAREAAEGKRLLYVACTRAREELHLFASLELSSKGEAVPEPGSLLKSAWPAAEPHFAATLAESAPQPAIDDQDVEASFAIAASAPEAAEQERSIGRNTTLQRLPIAFDPIARLRKVRPLHISKPEEGHVGPRFERPEGSISARAFGNAVHAFLERITQQIDAGMQPESIRAGLPRWTPRIAAVLRSEGLEPAVITLLTQRVVHALDATLKDPQGLWLLSPHEGAATEYALTAWTENRTAVRMDRIFRAGLEPLRPGSEALWVVDYKTTTHGPEGLEEFLKGECAKYAPQMETYAGAIKESEGDRPIRLALYFPMLSRLTWWSL